MKPLLEILHQAQTGKYAIGHFNISTLDAAWAIINTAKKLNVPVVIGVSEGERDFIGVNQTASIIHSIRHQLDHPIYLNADHTYSLDRIKEVVAAGYDSVIFDGAQLDQKQNIARTKEVVDFVKSVNPHILVEAEIGYIGTSSSLLEELPPDAIVDKDAMPTVEDIKHFISQTNVDLLSPAIGNIHGMLKNTHNPQLNIDLIKDIKKSISTPLVLHGGSGITHQNLLQAIKAGICMIHVNTEIRVAWKEGLIHSLEKYPDQVAPYKLLTPAQAGVARVVTGKLKLFHQL